jgi:hypothetical protein
MRSKLDQVFDALNNILMHKILVGIAYKKLTTLLFYLVFWNALTFNKLHFLKFFQFWRLLSAYLSDSCERDELGAFFLGQFTINDSRFFLGMMKISTGLGFFEIGSKFNIKHCQSLIYDFDKRKTSHRYKNAIKGALSLGDIERVKLYTDRQKYDYFAEKELVFFESVILFLHICSGSVQNFNCSRSDFDQYLSNRNIILLGPAPLGEELKYLDIENPIVCRRVGLGADYFYEKNNNFSNFKIAYTDPYFIENKNDLSSWIYSLGLDFIVSNQNIKDTQIFRTARGFNNLFSSGAANKMPLAIYDILLGGPSKLYCDGITFFASEISYTNESLDFHHNNIRINNRGSGGSDFYVSVSMAEHNVFTNRNLVKNLSKNPSIYFSSECKNILALSETEYATQLDILYGGQRR